MAPVEFSREGRVANAKQYDDKNEFGLVLGVGPGRRLESGLLEKPVVKVGDFILFGKYGSIKIRSLGADVLFIRQEDIMSIYGG